MLKYLSRNKIRRANVVIALMLVLSMVLPFVPTIGASAEGSEAIIEINSPVTGYTDQGQDDWVRLENGIDVRFAVVGGSNLSLTLNGNSRYETRVESDTAKQVLIDIMPNGKAFVVRVGGKQLNPVDNKYIIEIPQGSTSPYMIDIEESNGGQGGQGDGTYFNIKNIDSVDTQINGVFVLGWNYLIKCETSPLKNLIPDQNDQEKIIEVRSENIDKSVTQKFVVEMDEDRPFENMWIGPDKISFNDIPGDKKETFTETVDGVENHRLRVTIGYAVPAEANGPIEVSLESDFAPPQMEPEVIMIGDTVILDENVPKGTEPIAQGWEDKIHFVNEGEIIEIEINDGNKLYNLGPIKATGGRTIAIAVREYDLQDEAHPTVNIVSNQEGYAVDVDGDFELLGDWDCSAVINGSVKARGFRNRDIKKTTINGGIELINNDATISLECSTDIIADGVPAFKNARNVFANTGAVVNVSVSGSGNKAFDGVDLIEVGTGGIINVSTSNGAALNTPANVSSIKINDVGTIADIKPNEREGKSIPCSVGDKSSTDRYKYSNDGSKLSLESTTRPMHSISFQSEEKYDEKGKLRDDYVENGTFEVLASSGMRRIDDNGNVDYLFEDGCEVTFKLLPKAGYQYKPGTFDFNGGNGVGKATEDPGVYIYEMGTRPVHVSCTFVKTDDTIVNDSKAISGVAITVPEGTIANGTAEFDVKDATLTATQKESFAKVAGELEVAQTLDLKFGQKIDKIDAEGSWNIPITDLEKPMEISLKLGDNETYEDYAVIREHNGKVEELESKYDEKTNTITFKTNGYSTYAIAHTAPKKTPAGPKPDNTPTPQNNTPTGGDNSGNNGGSNGVKSPRTGESNLPFVLFASSMLAVVAAGIVYSLRRKQGN